jgi:very-short-patch-repair endonuclease
MLIIEIDGYTHRFEDVVTNSKNKQKDLESIDFIVLRYRDEDILDNIYNVFTDIEDTIKEILNK